MNYSNATRACAAITVSSAAVVIAYAWYHRPPKPQQLRVKAQCRCGKVCFMIDEKAPIHLVCYCDDCQRYAQWAQKQGLSVVDIQGGSRTCQVFRRNVKILRGSDLLQFSYLDPAKVPYRPQRMYRGHTVCCNTPMCSAFWEELPVMGLYASNFVLGPVAFLSPDSTSKLWEDRAEKISSGRSIPAPEYRINCRYAKKDKASGGYKGDAEFPISFLLRFLWRNFVVSHKVSSLDFRMPSPSTVVMRAE